jgi:hypothetical protein
MTVASVFADLAAHPWRGVAMRWNWKAATLSATLRGSIFFATSLTSGVGAASRALAVDATFRIPSAGMYAAIVQAFAQATPGWLAAVVVAVLVPVCSHTVEFLVHQAAHTPGLRASIAASIVLSIMTSVFELFAMRRGVFITGPGAASLSGDLGDLPRLLLAFLKAPGRWRPRWLHRR